VATVFLANNEKEFDRAKMDAAFANEVYEYDSKELNILQEEIPLTEK
jgi:hypothetical protein